MCVENDDEKDFLYIALNSDKCTHVTSCEECTPDRSIDLLDMNFNFSLVCLPEIFVAKQAALSR